MRNLIDKLRTSDRFGQLAGGASPSLANCKKFVPWYASICRKTSKICEITEQIRQHKFIFYLLKNIDILKNIDKN